MKIFHTADWHLGKLVQGVYMTEDQEFVLHQFVDAIKREKPDVIIVAGDLYDRAVPPTDAVNLLNNIFNEIVLELKTPVLAITGNHDSPGRLDFGTKIMRDNGLFIVGQLSRELEPVVLKDEFGEVHFHLIPYVDPSVVRHLYEDDDIRSHDDAMKRIISEIEKKMDTNSRHIMVGHAFVTPQGEPKDNTSESERPLSIGGAEHVHASYFEKFHYTALGHLHQAHYVGSEKVRYAGSPLKYSISEEHHNKGFLVIDMDGNGDVTVEKRELKPKRDMYTVEATMEQLLQHKSSDDYVFVRLLDETPVLYPMEKIRSVYPNCMHVERRILLSQQHERNQDKTERHKMSDLELFQAFYKEVKGVEVSEEVEKIFTEILNETLRDESELQLSKK
ncbi:exonuclease SbcCD subunit D [Bacillaceae bacterium W0354]